MHKLAHNGTLFRIYLANLNLQLLVFRTHFVYTDSELMTLFVELCFLTKVELLMELSLILTLPEPLLQAEARATGIRLLFILGGKLLAS